MVDPKVSIFYQELANFILIQSLAVNGFTESDYFNKMKWSVDGSNLNNIKGIFRMSGIGNPAMLQMCLYGLLVMPRELVGNDFCKDEFNEWAKDLVESCNSNYPGENSKENINFYRHIRNAVAHSKCIYTVENDPYVTFVDQMKTSGNTEPFTCSIKMKTVNVEPLLYKLEIKMMEFIDQNR